MSAPYAHRGDDRLAIPSSANLGSNVPQPRELGRRDETSQPTLARLETTVADTKLSTVERFAYAPGYSIEYHLVPAESSKRRPTRRHGYTLDE